jgi:UDP-glucose 4-epimerase
MLYLCEQSWSPGGAGYIGSHTAKALANAGYLPVVLDNLSTGHRGAVKWGPLVEGEIEDRDLVRAVLGTNILA